MPATPGGRALAGVAIAASVAIVVAAQRDLHVRPDDQVRGDRRVWRLVCLNALGALAYFRFGRRQSPSVEDEQAAG
jgi:hypothetical protein